MNPGLPDPSPPRQPLLVAALSLLVYMLSGAALAFPLSAPPVVFAVAVGAALGAMIGAKAAAGRLRLPVILLALAAGLLLVAVARRLALDTVWLARMMGPARALFWTDTLGYGAGAALFASGLRTAALRYRFLSVFEVALVATAFAQLVVAHRHGAINRPFEIADPIIAMGGDPTALLLLIGAITAFVIVLLLMRESSPLRSLLHLGVALAVLALILSTTGYAGLPEPPITGDRLGLRGREKRGQARNERNRLPRSSNEQLQFRDDYSPSGDQVPVAVVLLHDDYSPPSGAYYFRQNAFSQYNGRKLVAAARSDLDRDVANHFPAASEQLEEVPNREGDRVTLQTTVALLAEHKRPFALESPLRFEPLANPDPGRFRRLYRVTSQSLSGDVFALFGRQAGDVRWNGRQERHYTAAPEDGRYRQLAERILDGIREELRDDPFARALAVAVWLSREGTYSMRSGHSRATDPTADFLFGDKIGYCVHFAHAAVFLMRALGLPSRISTGYVVEESARRGGSTIVLTGANSHAWPELYLDGVGWVVVDITPQRALDPPPPPLDPDLQRLLGEMVRGQRPLRRDAVRPFTVVARMAKDMWGILGRFVLVVAVLVVVFLYLIKLWRRLAPAVARGRSLPRLLYRAELDRFAEVHLRRHFGESRESFAARVARISPAFTSLTRAHLRAVFGATEEADPGHRPPSELRTLARKTRAELRAAVRWWRRIIGVLTPWSWLRTR